MGGRFLTVVEKLPQQDVKKNRVEPGKWKSLKTQAGQRLRRTGNWLGTVYVPTLTYRLKGRQGGNSTLDGDYS